MDGSSARAAVLLVNKFFFQGYHNLIGAFPATAVLRAPSSALGVGTWHTVRALRKKDKGRLEVDGKLVDRAKASGSEMLELGGALFIGGAKFWDYIPAKVNVRDGFDGCVEAVMLLY